MLQQMKAYAAENSKGVAGHHSLEIRPVSCGSNQPSQQKQCQAGLKGTEPGQNERESCQTLGILPGGNGLIELFCCEHVNI